MDCRPWIVAGLFFACLNCLPITVSSALDVVAAQDLMVRDSPTSQPLVDFLRAQYGQLPEHEREEMPWPLAYNVKLE